MLRRAGFSKAEAAYLEGHGITARKGGEPVRGAARRSEGEGGSEVQA